MTGSPATTDAAGLASVTVTLGTTAQALTVTALATGVVETATFNLTAQAGPAAAVSKVLGDSQSGPAGAALGQALVVKVADQYDNPSRAQPSCL